ESDALPDVEASQDQPVSAVEIGSEIPQTDVNMALRILNLMWLKINLMVGWSIEVLNVMEEADPDDVPLD
ncbi:hypothetical protein A2U01_0111154, partial [Trifolium medium]|nr:hypothetical protein [Trifolium medium]